MILISVIYDNRNSYMMVNEMASLLQSGTLVSSITECMQCGRLA